MNKVNHILRVGSTFVFLLFLRKGQCTEWRIEAGSVVYPRDIRIRHLGVICRLHHSSWRLIAYMYRCVTLSLSFSRALSTTPTLAWGMFEYCVMVFASRISGTTTLHIWQCPMLRLLPRFMRRATAAVSVQQLIALSVLDPLLGIHQDNTFRI